MDSWCTSLCTFNTLWVAESVLHRAIKAPWQVSELLPFNVLISDLCFGLHLSQVPSPTRLHVSNPNLSSSEPCYGETFLQTPDSPTNAARLQEDFCRLASTSEGLRNLITSVVLFEVCVTTSLPLSLSCHLPHSPFHAPVSSQNTNCRKKSNQTGSGTAEHGGLCLCFSFAFFGLLCIWVCRCTLVSWPWGLPQFKLYAGYGVYISY